MATNIPQKRTAVFVTFSAEINPNTSEALYCDLNKLCKCSSANKYI